MLTNSQRDRRTDRQTDRQTDGETDRRTDTHHRRMDMTTYTHTHILTTRTRRRTGSQTQNTQTNAYAIELYWTRVDRMIRYGSYRRLLCISTHCVYSWSVVGPTTHVLLWQQHLPSPFHPKWKSWLACSEKLRQLDYMLTTALWGSAKLQVRE